MTCGNGRAEPEKRRKDHRCHSSHRQQAAHGERRQHVQGVKVQLNFGPAFQFFELDSNDNKGRFILQTAQNGLDPTTFLKNNLILVDLYHCS